MNLLKRLSIFFLLYILAMIYVGLLANSSFIIIEVGIIGTVCLFFLARHDLWYYTDEYGS